MKRAAFPAGRSNPPDREKGAIDALLRAIRDVNASELVARCDTISSLSLLNNLRRASESNRPRPHQIREVVCVARALVGEVLAKAAEALQIADTIEREQRGRVEVDDASAHGGSPDA